MSMFPPELESTKYSGPPAPPPKPHWWEGPKVHPKAFWHGLLAFTAANLPWAIVGGGKPLYYAMALLVGFAFAFRWSRRLGTLKWIYGFGAGWCVISALLAAVYAG
jgi:hypothetical protein